MPETVRPSGGRSVMESRSEPSDSRDDFPTPNWATRALLEHVIMPELAHAPEIARFVLRKMTVLEPAANRGYMAKTLAEYFRIVWTSDIHDYGVGITERDFLLGEPPPADFVITNPPFVQAERFIQQSFAVPGWQGIAMLVRTTFLESVGRYEKLFKIAPPSIVAQFSERVPMVKGRLTETGSTATAYCWLVYLRNHPDVTRLMWIPPCRRALERPGDYPAEPSQLTTASPEDLVPC